MKIRWNSFASLLVRPLNEPEFESLAISYPPYFGTAIAVVSPHNWASRVAERRGGLDGLRMASQKGHSAGRSPAENFLRGGEGCKHDPTSRHLLLGARHALQSNICFASKAGGPFCAVPQALRRRDADQDGLPIDNGIKRGLGIVIP
jgi:hypothetical protein